MSTLILILQVLGVTAAVLGALWAFAYFHQDQALKEQCRRLYAADPVSEVIHASVHMSDAELNAAAEYLQSERLVRRQRQDGVRAAIMEMERTK